MGIKENEEKIKEDILCRGVLYGKGVFTDEYCQKVLDEFNQLTEEEQVRKLIPLSIMEKRVTELEGQLSFSKDETYLWQQKVSAKSLDVAEKQLVIVENQLATADSERKRYKILYDYLDGKIHDFIKQFGNNNEVY